MTLPTWLDREFSSAFVVNDDDVGELTITETKTSGDARVTIRGLYGSAATPNATVIEVPLPWTVVDGSLWAVEAYVTAKGTGIRRRIKIAALLYGDGTTATLESATDVVDLGTGDATADITVSGAGMRLELDPDGDATALIWGFEIRAQQL